MSSNKKSMGSVLLLLLVFLAIAAASWFYFSGQQGGEDATGQAVQTAADDDHSGHDHDDHSGHDHEGHDHHDHSGHDHGANAHSVGEKGKIHDLTIKPNLGRRGLGDPNAPVQIQEFFSLTCNHCATFHEGAFQELKSKYIDTGKVYYVFEEFPLNGPALYGSMVARCLPEERYEGFIDLLLKNQDSWAFGGDFKNSLKQNAKLAGMSDEEFEACFTNKALQADVAQNVKEASEVWKISSTPSFVLNKGERIMRGGASIKDFDAVISELMSATN